MKEFFSLFSSRIKLFREILYQTNGEIKDMMKDQGAEIYTVVSDDELVSRLV